MMRHFPAYVLDVIFVLPLIFGAASAIEKRICYQCEVEDLALCTDEYLQPCPDNQAYDSCETRISKSKSKGFWIRKSCALGPCALRDASQSIGLGLDHCDRSKEEFDCFTCCKEDGCNTGDGALYRPMTTLIVVLIFIAFTKKYYV
ncbi:uncharacterized protein LOC118188092 [Stegodyphus dumicola]|uniref:uncharacterized protein LOC118188092 n=1 Tax=Stegodyphus dumicola TaxID=202533 RepID=UPI0015A8B35F|nr:uncharacterized protein LOC118188092 [Stegodyphus dumicola]